jgi:uncharacterized ion transporter superfamily protein YfcC
MGKTESHYRRKAKENRMKDPRTAFRITLAVIIMAAIATLILPVCHVAQAQTVRELVRVCKAHRQNCPLCGPVEIRRPSSKEPAQVRREAA